MKLPANYFVQPFDRGRAENNQLIVQILVLTGIFIFPSSPVLKK